MIQLDTSFLIRALVARTPEDRQLRVWIGDHTVLSVSTIAWTEFICGPVSSEVVAAAARVVGDPLPYGPAEAALAARLFNESGRRRGSMVDCMIAAVALEAGHAIATSNRQDFRRFEKFGLVIA